MKSFLASVRVPIYITIDPPCCISLRVQNEFIAYSLGEGNAIYRVPQEITDKLILWLCAHGNVFASFSIVWK